MEDMKGQINEMNQKIDNSFQRMMEMMGALTNKFDNLSNPIQEKKD